MRSSSIPSSTFDFMTSSVDADVTPGDLQLGTALTSVRDPAASAARAHLTPVEENVFQGVHTALTVLALAANCLSLLVIYGVVSQLTPPLRLLTSLSFAQMLTPWAIMTIYFSRGPCQDEIHTSVLLSSHNAAALTLLALALAYNVASFRPFDYESIVSSRRLWAGVAVIWIVALTLGHVHFLVAIGSSDDHPLSPEQYRGYCVRVADHTGISLSICLGLAFLVILTELVIYRRILVSMRPEEALVVDAPFARSTKGIVTYLILLTGYTVAWVPYLAIRSVVAYRSGETRTTLVTTGIWQAVIVVNCFLDPIVYGHRMEAMKIRYGTLAQRIRRRVAGSVPESHPMSQL